MSSALILHRGARHVQFEELAAVPVPAATKSWFPIPHHEVLQAVEETLAGAAFHVTKRELALSANDQAFFATLDLNSSVAEGVALAVGVRSSINQTMAQEFCAGNRVFVCDNLSFSADLMVNRKHTTFGGRRFREAIGLAVAKLDDFRKVETARVDVLRNESITNSQAESFILRAWEAGVINHLQLPKVLGEWRQPRHADFEARTRWSLFNSVTEILKPLSASNPRSFSLRTFNLNALLLPPNEGPIALERIIDVDPS